MDISDGPHSKNALAESRIKLTFEEVDYMAFWKKMEASFFAFSKLSEA